MPGEKGESEFSDTDSDPPYDYYKRNNRTGRVYTYDDHKEHHRQITQYFEQSSMSRDFRSSNPRDTRDYAFKRLENQDNSQESPENFIPGERRYYHMQIYGCHSGTYKNQSGSQRPDNSNQSPRRPKGSVVFSNNPNTGKLAVADRNGTTHEKSYKDRNSGSSDSDDYNEHNWRHNENNKKRAHRSEQHGNSSGSHITTTEFDKNRDKIKQPMSSTGFNVGGRFGDLDHGLSERPNNMEENQTVPRNNSDKILVLPDKDNEDNRHRGKTNSDFPIFHEGLLISKYSLTDREVNQKNVDSINIFESWRTEGLFLHRGLTDDDKIDKIYGLLTGNHSVKKTVIFVRSKTRGEELSQILSQLKIVKSNIIITSESACPSLKITEFDQFIQFDFPKEEGRSKDMFLRCSRIGMVKATSIHVLIHPDELRNYSEAVELKRIYEEKYRALFPGFLFKSFQRACKFRRFDKYNITTWLYKRNNEQVQRKYMDGFPPAELSDDDW